MKNFLFIILSLCSLSLFAQEKYDSTFNFIHKDNVESIIGQTISISRESKYLSGFYNIFWKDLKGHVYKGSKSKKTRYEDVINKSFFVKESMMGKGNPILKVIDENDEILYINYNFEHDTYFPFVIQGYIEKNIKVHVGKNLYLDKSNIDNVRCYSSFDFVSLRKNKEKYSTWRCIDYIYKDEDAFKDWLVLQNGEQNILEIPLKYASLYFKDSIDEYKESLVRAEMVMQQLRVQDSIFNANVLKQVKTKFENKVFYSVDTRVEPTIPFGESVQIVRLDGIKNSMSINAVIRYKNEEISIPFNYVEINPGVFDLDNLFYLQFSKTKKTRSSYKKPIKRVSPWESVVRLKIGMSMSEVTKIMGSPERTNYVVNSMLRMDFWHYAENRICLNFKNGVLDTIVTI